MGPTKESPHPMPAITLGHTPSSKSRKGPANRTPQTIQRRKRLDKSEQLLTKEREVAQVLVDMSETAQPSTSQHKDSQQHSTITPGIKCDSCGNGISKTTRTQISRENIRHEVTISDENCFRYNGVPTIATLMFLFKWLEPFAVFQVSREGNGTTKRRLRKRKLSLLEEFLLTLIRIRRGYDTRLMAFLFGISQSQVCRIFNAWIRFLNKCVSPLIIWPGREEVLANLPDSFKMYPRTRCIIDCTEYFVEKPFRPAAQRQTWSMYKHNNTFKQLVGIMPSGAFTFLSKVYSGSVSDLQIVKKSNFLDKVEEGDDIMADREFNIRHLLLEKKATLNIPAFTHGKNLSQKAVNRSKKIARVRIHVERAIRRLKTFRILSGIIPIALRHNIDELVTIAAFLCNLQPPLVR